MKFSLLALSFCLSLIASWAQAEKLLEPIKLGLRGSSWIDEYELTLDWNGKGLGTRTCDPVPYYGSVSVFRIPNQPVLIVYSATVTQAFWILNLQTCARSEIQLPKGSDGPGNSDYGKTPQYIEFTEDGYKLHSVISLDVPRLPDKIVTYKYDLRTGGFKKITD